MLKLNFFLVLSVIFSGSLFAQSVSLTIHYDSQAYLSDGSYQTTQFDDLFVRDQQNVWFSRIFPPLLEKLHNNQVEPINKHLDLTSSARWIHKDNSTKGEITLKLFNPKDRTLVSVPKIEFGSVGFDGNWDRAYFLFPPEYLKKMKKTESKQDKLTGYNLDRYESVANNQETSVVWNRDLKIPEKISYKNKNGLLIRNISVTVNSKDLAIIKPWETLGKTIQREYEDYLD